MVNETALPGWPLPCDVVEGGEKHVKLSGLPPKYKKLAWMQINERSPALAELLREPLLKAIVSAFEAEIFVDAQYVPGLPVYRPLGLVRRS